MTRDPPLGRTSRMLEVEVFDEDAEDEGSIEILDGMPLCSTKGNEPPTERNGYPAGARRERVGVGFRNRMHVKEATLRRAEACMEAEIHVSWSSCGHLLFRANTMCIHPKAMASSTYNLSKKGNMHMTLFVDGSYKSWKVKYFVGDRGSKKLTVAWDVFADGQ